MKLDNNHINEFEYYVRHERRCLCALWAPPVQQMQDDPVVWSSHCLPLNYHQFLLFTEDRGKQWFEVVSQSQQLTYEFTHWDIKEELCGIFTLFKVILMSTTTTASRVHMSNSTIQQTQLSDLLL